MMEEQDYQEQDISGSTMYLTDIVEEGDRFGVAKGPDGAFHAISKAHACTHVQPKLQCSYITSIYRDQICWCRTPRRRGRLRSRIA